MDLEINYLFFGEPFPVKCFILHKTGSSACTDIIFLENKILLRSAIIDGFGTSAFETVISLRGH